MQAVLTRHGFVASPDCPPNLLRAHTHLVYFILRAFDAEPNAAPITALLAAVAEWHRRYDELADAQPVEQVFLVRDTRLRLRLACTAGCNHCCATPVSLIGPEALAIAAHIHADFSPAEQAALGERIAAYQSARSTATATASPSPMCPLNVDGKCTVYAARPLNCRKWHSFAESACRRLFRDGDRTTPIPRSPARADESGLVWQSAVAAFSLLGVDIHELDLVPTLALILADAHTTPRYVAGEPLFTAARRAPG